MTARSTSVGFPCARTALLIWFQCDAARRLPFKLIESDFSEDIELISHLLKLLVLDVARRAKCLPASIERESPVPHGLITFRRNAFDGGLSSGARLLSSFFPRFFGGFLPVEVWGWRVQ